MIPLLLLSSLVFAQKGYEIKVTLKPIKNQYIYLGHYSGKQYPVVDSVKLNEKSEGVFKGPKELGGGIYLVVYPNKDRFLEILIDKKQHFSLIADTNDSRAKKFVNSIDNELFNQYQQYMAKKGATIESNNNALKAAKTTKDSAGITENIKKNFRRNIGLPVTVYCEATG